MFKYIATFILAVSAMSANAGGHGHFHKYHSGFGWGWVAPTIIGGVVGYEIAKSQQPTIVQPTVVQPPVVVQTQVMNDPNLVIVNGVLYRKVTMLVNGVYQDVLVKP